MLDASADVGLVPQLMGHSSVATTGGPRQKAGSGAAGGLVWSEFRTPMSRFTERANCYSASMMSYAKGPILRAGESTDARAQEHFHKWFCLIGFASATVSLCLIEWLSRLAMGWTWPIASTVAAPIVVGWVALVIRKDWQPVLRILRGARGEREVGELLEDLRNDGYVAVHGVPIHAIEDGRPVGDIDHVLIGPAGVFAIETKRLSRNKSGRMPKIAFDGSQVTIDGRLPDRNPVAQARRAALEASRIVKNKTGRDVKVRALVVYPGCWVSSVPAGEVGVINPKQLFGWVRLQPASMRREDAELVRHVLVAAASSKQ
jgi:hypothetical protein